MNSNRVSNVFTGALGINALITGFAADDIHLRIQYWAEISVSVCEGDFADFVSSNCLSYFTNRCRTRIYTIKSDLWRVNHNFVASLTTVRSGRSSGTNRADSPSVRRVGRGRQVLSNAGEVVVLLCISMQTRARHGGLLSTTGMISLYSARLNETGRRESICTRC